MKKLEKIYNLAEKRNYRIENCDLKDIKQKGLIFNFSGETSILIDYNNISSTAEEKVVAAHEVGHAETNSLYKIDSDNDTIRRCEYRATKWAVKNLIPFPEYLHALLSGNVEIWQLAEHFNVTEDFILKTHNVYLREGLI